MPTILIADPRAWAKTNGYTIYQNKVSERYYSVFRGERAIGVLKQTADGFEFISETPVDPMTDPEEKYSFSSEQQQVYNECISSGDFFSSSFGVGLPSIDFSKLEVEKPNEVTLQPRDSGTGEVERISECNFWLPYAAQQYNVSPNLRDYVVVPLPVMISDLPNTNGDSLSLQQMLRFDTNVGRQMFKTFQGMGVYHEHANKDPLKAAGIILDSFLRPIKGFGGGKFFKIVHLLAVDRTKNAQLAKSILDKTSNAYSVGFQYTAYTCSICGHRVGKGIDLTPCAHTRLFQPTYKQPDGRLVYRKCENAKGFECSAVANPAFTIAIGPTVFDASSY
jgi:hypothetical protein